MEQLIMQRLRLRDFPSRSFYCIQEKSLPYPYHLHQHDFFEIELILNGEGEHYLNGHLYPLRRGSAYFLNLNDFHEITVEQPLQIMTFMFSDHWVKDTLLYQVLGNENDMQCLMAENEFQQVLRIAESVREEYESTGALRDIALRNMTEYLLITLLRRFDIEIAHLTENVAHPVSQVLLYLSAHFRENPTLAEMAMMVNHNSNYFSELFHKTTGQSYVQYLKQLKLNYARKLLTSTETSITDISTASGFNSYSNFSHAFREAYGCSAYDFRRSQQELHKKKQKN